VGTERGPRAFTAADLERLRDKTREAVARCREAVARSRSVTAEARAVQKECRALWGEVRRGRRDPATPPPEGPAP